MIRPFDVDAFRKQPCPLSSGFRVRSLLFAALVILDLTACTDAFAPTAATSSGIGQNVGVHGADVVDATDFGLKPCQVPGCDPQGESQTEALHAAMRHFFDQGIAGTVFVPAGEYAVDEALRLHAGVSLIGDGMGKTIIKKVGDQVNYVVGNPVLNPGSTALNITVADLTIDADRTRRAALGMAQVGAINIDADVSNLTLERIGARDATNAMILRRLKDSVIQDNHIDGKTGHGIATGMEGLPVGEFRDVIIRNNRITHSSGGAGINLSRAANTVAAPANNNRIINNRISTLGVPVSVEGEGAGNIVVGN